MLRNKSSKAISTVEYGMLIVAVLAALIGIQIYLKRALADRYRQAGDTFGFGRQYQSPGIIWER